MPDVLYETHPEGHYAIFTMNRPDRPDRLNAQGALMRQELDAALYEFVHDPEMRVGIVTGAGRAFSAGADLKEMTERNQTESSSGETGASGITPEERAERGRSSQPFGVNPKPIIAAINGLAIAAGMERAADCDIRIASTEAYFGLFEVKRGILAHYALNHLARLMPYGEAMYLMLTGDILSVEEAHRLGFVHQVLPPGQLMPRAVEIAEMIGKNAPLAVQATRAVAQVWRRYGLDESLRVDGWVSHFALNSEDAKEGPRAFAEKREPVWKGRVRWAQPISP